MIAVKNVVKPFLSFSLFASLSLISLPGMSESGRVVGMETHNWIWSNLGTTITFDPDAAGPNVVCELYGGESRSIGTSVAGTMAMIAREFHSQFDSVSVACGGNTLIEVSLHKSGNQAYTYYNGNDNTYEFTTINGVSCFTATAGHGDKVALAMATGRSMTATCTPNPYVGENILNVVY